MKKYIINISREFGCNAREVARQLAARRAIEFHDQDLIRRTCEKAGIHEDQLPDETDARGDGKSLIRLFGYGSTTNFYSEAAVRAQMEVIREYADQPGSCIFFGRCADYVLKEYPNRLNVFLYAPLDKRIDHIAKSYNLSKEESAKLIRRVDKQRHNYYKFITGENRGDRDNKQVMLDVSEFGIEGTAVVLDGIVKYHFGLDE